MSRLWLIVLLIPFSALADTVTFDKDKVDALPKGWIAGVTGNGSFKWAVVADSDAPSKPNVLKQTGVGDFPWCVKSDAKLTDGFVEVRFKPLGGKEDQAGGVIWRWKSGDSYYIARGNASENNVALFYVENGRRKTIKYVDAPIPDRAWSLLRVEFSGKKIKVSLNGKTYIDLEDDHISGAGAVGVWTKADSVTAFDDFKFGQ